MGGDILASSDRLLLAVVFRPRLVAVKSQVMDVERVDALSAVPPPAVADSHVRALGCEPDSLAAVTEKRTGVDRRVVRSPTRATTGRGAQAGIEHLAEAVYEGTLAEFLTGWFDRE